MNARKLLLSSLLLVIVFTAGAHAKAWREIVPLSSTRADVERLLGSPNVKYGRYLTENEVADIFYSKGRCANGWDVPEGTVINIVVTFKQSRRLSDLKLDLSKYQKFNDPLTTNHAYYVNRNEGLRYTVVDGNDPEIGLILNVYYESTSEGERTLRCKKPDPPGVGPVINRCPVVAVGCKERGLLPVTFTLTYGGPLDKVSFSWTVSGGTIIEGQGTTAITVAPSTGVKKITATVRIDGLPKLCSNEDTCTTEITTGGNGTNGQNNY